MGACRESSKMEKSLSRFLSQLRDVDKILWLYSGKNMEHDPNPLDTFSWIESELNEAHNLWMDVMEEKRRERDRLAKLNAEKLPKKAKKKVTYDYEDDEEEFLKDITDLD